MVKLRRAMVVILTAVLLVYVLMFSKRGTRAFESENDEEIKQALATYTPYRSLYSCETLANCPDIRTRVQATTLRTSQIILTRMMRVFSLICKKHGIPYFLYRGSLLGAARHKGHNPFDNDVDVAVLQKDFSRLEKAMQLDLPADMFFQTEATDPHYKTPALTNMLAKLRDRSSCYKEMQCKQNCLQNGLMLDITVLPQDDLGNLLDLYSTPGYLWRYLIGPVKYEYSDMFPLKELVLDGFMFTVPNKWHEYLQRTYGETYMTIPSPGSRYPLQSGSTVDNFRACDWSLS